MSYKEQLLYDNIDNTFTFHRYEDIEPIVDMNKAFQNSGSDGYTPSRDLKHVGRIPIGMLEHWEDELGLQRGSLLKREYWDVLKRKLNDPENKFLRTGGGKL